MVLTRNYIQQKSPLAIIVFSRYLFFMTNTLSRLIERLGRIVQNDAHSFGLKPTQWEALRFLNSANRFSRTPSGLTIYLGMTKGTVSQTLSALERKGLISKTKAAGDKRGVMLDMTPLGKQALKADPLKTIEEDLDRLTQRERDELFALLSKFLKAMLARRDSAQFGQCRDCMHFVSSQKGALPHFCALLAEPLSGADSELMCVEYSASERQAPRS
ncbi:MAG: MarR family transcriptional regulator [Alphaproteobacteria bacterium]|nr:MarR family transcriptional regulator [Alphaproteobacteria bacterium]